MDIRADVQSLIMKSFNYDAINIYSSLINNCILSKLDVKNPTNAWICDSFVVDLQTCVENKL